MVKARRWTLAKHFDGFPKAEDLKMVEVELPAIQDGEILVDVVFLSVDPYMRSFSASWMKEGDTMVGGNLGKVIESKDPAFPVGCHVVSQTGWTTRAVVNCAKDKPKKCPELSGLSLSMYLGVLGLTGLTAYFGLLSVLDPKPGETLLVNAAAGAVGSIVGQIGKIKGCTVIGCAGTDDKVKWVKDLGFDHVFNYKTCDLDKTLKEMAPNGIDCYFDNVGGDFTHTVLTNHMKNGGRISLCGAIDQYNDTDKTSRKNPYPPMALIYKNLKMEGFMVLRWESEFGGAIKEMIGWITQGKLKHKEHVTEGFENMPTAFFELFSGKNTGKAVVKM